MRATLWISSVVACAVARDCLPQDAPRGFEALRGDALTGTVLDLEDRPIAGAKISLVAIDSHDGPVEFQQAALHQLRYTPLPAGRTGDDGGFNLALTRDQSRLGIVGGLELMLAVEKEGFRSWQGPIGTCPARVGKISVRLAPIDPRDVIEGAVILPEGRESRPTGRIDVVYDARPAWSEGPAEASSVLVGKEGAFAVPRRCNAFETSVINGWSSQLRSEGFHLWPAFEGFTGTPTWFDREARRFDLRLVAAEDLRPPVDVRLAAGAPRPAELTVLYRSKSLGWWRRSVPFGRVRTIGTWMPHAVEAPGCAAASVVSDSDGTWGATLAALPREPVRLRITGKGGAPIEVAEVEVVELTERTITSPNTLDPAGRRALRSFVAAGGTVDVPAELFTRIHHVSVQAAGHAPYRSVDLAKCLTDPRIELTAIPSGRLHLVVKHRGVPVDGASFFFGNETYLRASIPGPPLKTAGDGTFKTTLPSGTHRVGVFSDNLAFEVVECELRAGADLRLEVKLEDAGGAFVQLLDARGKQGKPFVRQPVAWRVMTGERPRQCSAYSYTGDDGRARLDGVPPELGEVALITPGLTSATPDGLAWMDTIAASGSVRLAAADAGEVRLRLPPGLSELNTQLSFGRAAHFVRFHVQGAGDLRFPAEAGMHRVLVSSPLLPILPQTVAAAGPTSIDLRMTDWLEVVVDCELDGTDAAALRVVHVSEEDVQSEGPGTDLARIWRKPGDGDRRLRFRVPPKGRFGVRLQHPQLLPQILTYVDGKGPRDVVQMKRGATLKLAFPALSPGMQEQASQGRVAVELTRGGTEQESKSLPLGISEMGAGRNLEVAWPTALAEGSYALRVRSFPMSGYSFASREFGVKGTEPVTLEFRRRAAPPRGR